MNILYFTIPFAMMIGALFVFAFVWVVRTGQYEDLETPAVRILFEEKKNETERES